MLDCHPLHCSLTLSSLHPAVNLLTKSCSCKTDNNNDGFLQIKWATAWKRFRQHFTSAWSVTSASVAPTHFRISAKGFRTGFCWARGFSCCIPAMAQKTIQHRRLLSGGLTPTTSISFERDWDKERNSSSFPPSLLRLAWLWSISRIWTCACIRVTTATTTNWLGNDAKTVATTVSTTRRGQRKKGFEKPTLDKFWEWQQVSSCSVVFVLPFERKINNAGWGERNFFWGSFSKLTQGL